YYQVDGISSPVRTTGPITLPAGSLNHVYQLIDSYPMLRARLAGTSGSVSVLARVYGIPI
ncbi:MAG: hypothetical protein JOZ41_00880, partial [Chloroflexi bacterium]|nr:hypothetical protein [Chloroflexota bacterium]